MGNLFYGQLGLVEGTSAAAVPNVSEGPFHNLQPYLYWTCGGPTIQSPCQAAGPVPNFEWSYSFGSGFQGTDLLANSLFVTAYFAGSRSATNGSVIAEVANAEGEVPVIAPNTWIEVKGVNLAPAGDARTWQASDFAGSQMPTQLDHVSVTVNGKSAYVYYVSPAQINVLTPPDTVTGPVQVIVTNNAITSAPFTVQEQALSPSFFVFNGGPYVAAVHTDGTLIGPATLFPGSSAPAKPGEVILFYANGFGITSTPVIAGSDIQGGTLSPLPAVTVGGAPASVSFAGLTYAGEFQFNVTIPSPLPDGDQAITRSYGGASTQSSALITIHK